MKHRRIFPIPGRIIIFSIVSALLLFGCSLPRIIVLHDPLTTEEHDNLGRIYESEGKLDLASDQYHQALKKDPKHIPSLLLLGDLSYRMKDYAEAESAYTKALKLDSKNAGVRNNLAWVYIQTGKKLDKAKELITEALALDPGQRPYYLDTLGVVLLKLGNTSESIAALEESVDTLPKDKPELLAEAEGHLADAYKAAGDETQYHETMHRQK
ncbi:MAG: tetratricopeptide repeat protein, partial [Betaproteobacteria bacterium]